MTAAVLRASRRSPSFGNTDGSKRTLAIALAGNTLNWDQTWPDRGALYVLTADTTINNLGFRPFYNRLPGRVL